MSGMNWEPLCLFFVCHLQPTMNIMFLKKVALTGEIETMYYGVIIIIRLTWMVNNCSLYRFVVNIIMVNNCSPRPNVVNNFHVNYCSPSTSIRAGLGHEKKTASSL